MSFSINAAQAADKTQWQTLYQGYAEFYKVPMNQTILDTVWQWIEDEQQPFFCLIAKDEQGEALGLMHFREMASPLRGAKVGFLDDLFIAPQARGQGLVTALFARLELEAKEQQWPLVRWITADNNYRARAVYDQVANKTQWLTYQLTL